MSARPLIVILCCLGVGIGVLVGTYPQPAVELAEDTQVERSQSNATFSNTQSWDPALLTLTHTSSTLLHQDQYAALTLPSPPENVSTTTTAELQVLHTLMNVRTPDNLQAINRELTLPATVFGGATYAMLTSTSTYPQTRSLLHTVLRDFEPIILQKKRQFDRVRPSKLDPGLTTAIAVPRHPSYPSGHAAQSHLIALILSDSNPTQAENYQESAAAIAFNREIAGVHYRSDTWAGRSLAEQYYHFLQTNEWYQTQLELAQKEWPNL